MEGGSWYLSLRVKDCWCQCFIVMYKQWLYVEGCRPHTLAAKHAAKRVEGQRCYANGGGYRNGKGNHQAGGDDGGYGGGSRAQNLAVGRGEPKANVPNIPGMYPQKQHPQPRKQPSTHTKPPKAFPNTQNPIPRTGGHQYPHPKPQALPATAAETPGAHPLEGRARQRW
jgi:hypothetical protein